MSSAQDGNGVDAGADWSGDHRFEVVIGIPVVRAAISGCAARAGVPMSAEEFLARAAAVVPAFGRAMNRGAIGGRALALSRGWGTGTSRDAEIPAPIGRVIACVLCSMAFHAQAVQAVEQREDGCTLTAGIPSDRKTFGGVLRVSVDRGDGGTTTVRAQAQIPGQLYDWGKSKQTLAALFADLLALPSSGTRGIGIAATPTAP
jgi:hypothetical protein